MTSCRLVHNDGDERVAQPGCRQMAGSFQSLKSWRAWNIWTLDFQSGKFPSTTYPNIFQLVDFFARHGILPPNFYGQRTLTTPVATKNTVRHDDTLALRYVAKRLKIDMNSVRQALDIVNQCRRLPMMLETFLGG